MEVPGGLAVEEESCKNWINKYIKIKKKKSALVMSDFLYSCHCYSCCFLLFVLLLDCCCFPPKLSFIVRTRAAMCWFFWILFGYCPSANEGPSKVLKSGCQNQLCRKQWRRVVHRQHVYIRVHTLTDIRINTVRVQLPTFMQARTHSLQISNACLEAPLRTIRGCVCIKGLFLSACRKFSGIKGWTEFLAFAGS